VGTSAGGQLALVQQAFGYDAQRLRANSPILRVSDMHGPALLAHETADPIVPVTDAVAFAAAYPDSTLVQLEPGNDEMHVPQHGPVRGVERLPRVRARLGRRGDARLVGGSPGRSGARTRARRGSHHAGPGRDGPAGQPQAPDGSHQASGQARAAPHRLARETQARPVVGEDDRELAWPGASMRVTSSFGR
jgi:hypothetical protein